MKFAPIIFAVHACVSLKAYARKEPLFRLRDTSDDSETKTKARETRNEFFSHGRFSEDTFDEIEWFRELAAGAIDFSMSMMTQAPSPAPSPAPSTSAPTSSAYQDLLAGCIYFGSIEVPRGPTGGPTVDLKRGEFLCKDTNIPKNMVRFGLDETGLLGWWGIRIENGVEAWEKLWDVGIDAAYDFNFFADGSMGLWKETTPNYFEPVWMRGCATMWHGAYFGFDDDEPFLRELKSQVDHPRRVWQLTGRTLPTETDFCRDGVEGTNQPDITCVSSSLSPGDRLDMNQFICDGRYKWGVASSGKIEHWYQLSDCCSNHVMISSVGKEGEGNYLVAQSDGNVVQYDKNGVIRWATGCSFPGLEAYVTIEGASGDTSTSFGTVSVKDKCGHELWASRRDYVHGSCDDVSTYSSEYDGYDCRGEFLFPGETLEQGSSLCMNDLGFGLGEGNGAGRLGQYQDGFDFIALYRTFGGWDSGANGQSLRMQNSDGNLVLYDNNGAATWATGCLLGESSGKHILRQNQDIRGAEVYNSDSCEVVWRIYMFYYDEGDFSILESGCYPDRPGI